MDPGVLTATHALAEVIFFYIVLLYSGPPRSRAGGRGKCHGTGNFWGPLGF